MDFSIEKSIKQISKRINSNLKVLRLINNLTVARLSELSSVSRHSISSLEKKHYVKVQLDLIAKLCKVFNIALIDFLTKDLVEEMEMSKYKSINIANGENNE